MAALSSFFKVGSAFALITGTSDVLLGVGIVERTTGVSFPVNSAAAVFADSQIRFLGGMWAGWGAMLWWASNDLRTRRVPLAILGTVMVLSGIGRSISGVLHGFGSGLVVGATAVELVVPPAIWILGRW